MKRTSVISGLERASILICGFLTFTFFASFYVDAAVNNYNDSVRQRQNELRSEATGGLRKISFGINTSWRVPGGYHLITFFVFLSLIIPKRYTVPIILVVLYAGLFVASLYYQADGYDPGQVLPSLFVWDFVGAAFILIMFLWLSSIRLRLRSSTRNLYS